MDLKAHKLIWCVWGEFRRAENFGSTMVPTGAACHWPVQTTGTALWGKKGDM